MWFLKRLITDDEKWVVYNNITRKRSWRGPGEPTQTSKADIHQKKVLLSVWWDYKRVVYFELLPPNRTIISDVYIKQLTKLNNAVEVLYFIMTMQGHTHLWSPDKNYWCLVGMFCHIHHIVLTLQHLITFCFDLYKTPCMVKISRMMMMSNRTWFSFFASRSFMNVGLWCCLKDGKKSLIKMGNTLQNKVI